MSGPRPPLRSAEIIAVGSELLGSSKLDTNSLFLTERLARLGITVRAKAVVGDDPDLLGALFRLALDRADLVLLTGGLGPTADDVTREVVAGVLGLELIEDAGLLEKIERRFARRGLRMPAVNRKQAFVPRGAEALDNPNGTAPGLFVEHGDRVVLLLPGPPRELQPMMDVLCAGPLAARAGDERLHTVSLFVTGRGESHVEEIAEPIYGPLRDATPPIETTILASPGQIELHLTTRTADPALAERVLTDARERLAKALGRDVFSLDGRTMEQVVGDLLRERGVTVAAAESCTGGLLMARLTDVPGSSEYVVAGVVAYSNASKTALAGVDPALIQAHGAVSEPVALALAEGAKARTGAGCGIGITGIAGPGGGTTDKPVGTVAIAVVPPQGSARVRTFSFPGGRAQVRFQASQAALDMLRRLLT